MTAEDLKDYCLDKKGTTADFPFDDVTLTVRVGKKIFALIATDSDPLRVNLKCDPVLAMELRDRYDAITPGYHMNKLHWNTVVMDGTVPDDLVREMVDESYLLVFKSLRKAEREKIEA